MPSPLATVEVLDESGNTLHSTNAMVSQFKGNASLSADAFIGRDVRSLRLLDATGDLDFNTKSKVMLDAKTYSIVDIAEDGKWLDLLVERTR